MYLGTVSIIEDNEQEELALEIINGKFRLGIVIDDEGTSSYFIVYPNGDSESGYISFATANELKYILKRSVDVCK